MEPRILSMYSIQNYGWGVSFSFDPNHTFVYLTDTNIQYTVSKGSDWIKCTILNPTAFEESEYNLGGSTALENVLHIREERIAIYFVVPKI